jgi:hypothetical protein
MSQSTHAGPGGHERPKRISKVLKAGALYFALVFGAGFVLGSIRVLWLVPRIGERTAELSACSGFSPSCRFAWPAMSLLIRSRSFFVQKIAVIGTLQTNPSRQRTARGAR